MFQHLALRKSLESSRQLRTGPNICHFSSELIAAPVFEVQANCFFFSARNKQALVTRTRRLNEAIEQTHFLRYYRARQTHLLRQTRDNCVKAH